MDDAIRTYLQLTRGRNQFKESTDDVVDVLVHRYSEVLQQNNIKVAVIWSVACKNEIVTCADGTKVLVWDTNYWTHFCEYYHHIQNIDVLREQGAPEFALKLQADAAWRDLFRIAISRVKKNSINHQLLFSKYYLAYGTKILLPFQLSSKSYFDIANAKWYAFLHEIGHITLDKANEWYQFILTTLFSENLDEVKNFLRRPIDSEDGDYEQALEELIDITAQEIKDGNWNRAQEILVDMRAVHSICNTFYFTAGTVNIDLFSQLRTGFIYQRSFNLRIRSIEAHLKELSKFDSYSDHNDRILKSQYFQEFILRDGLSDYLEQHIVYSVFTAVPDCDGHEYLAAYLSETPYSRETAHLLDQTVRHHLANIADRIEHVHDNHFSISLAQSREIVDYLLSYPGEEDSNYTFNRPISIAGWSGLFFDVSEA